MVAVDPPPEAGENPYIPTSPNQGPLVFERIAGMNTSPDRPGVDDQQAFWLDGFMPLDNMNCRTLYDVGPQFVVSASPTIVFFDFFNIQAAPFAALFMSDGGVLSVNTDSGVVGVIAPPGTIVNPSIITVGSTRYGSEFFIFVSNGTVNGYWIWDGTTLFVPGGISPTGGVMPLGIQGSTVEIYAGRVWIGNASEIIFSAPGAVDDFTVLDGGGFFVSSDSFLKIRFTRLVSANGYLYMVADSSVNYISGVQTGGAPLVTTFTNQNIDAEVGSPFPQSVEVFGRNVLMANSFGVHVIYGSEVKKVSKPLDGVYTSLAPVFAGVQLCSGQATLFGRRCWSILVPIIDPIDNVISNQLMMWDGDKQWWSSKQSMVLQFIKHQEIDSTFTLWGTDGVQLRRLFVVPSSDFTKRAWSKLFSRPGGFMTLKTPGMLWSCFDEKNLSQTNILITLDTERGFADAQTYIINPSGTTGFYVPNPIAVSITGAMIGILVATTTADCVINSVGISIDITQYRG